MHVELDGQKIFDWRYRNVVTAEEAAQRAGVSVSTFLRAENGRGAVTLQTARKIARLLDVEPRSLGRA
jgi:transcriptional regulator with XRE-family HTH domain